MIPVVLVTGFLGSGKTTFLKRFARSHPHMRMVFLVNELSEVSVDGTTLAETGLPLHSVVGGSLFCECKASDFVRVMKESVATRNETSPLDAVLIETSGMADPEAIGKLMSEHGLDQWFEINRIVTIVSPNSFLKLMEHLPVVRRQVQHSDLVVINKTDLASDEAIQKTQGALSELAPDAEQVLAQFAELDFDLVQPRKVLPNEALAPCSANPFSTQTWGFVGACRIDDPKRWLASLPDYVLRAKGHLQTEDGWFRVEKTVDDVSATPCVAQDESCIVFIVHDEDASRLDKLCAELSAEYSAIYL